MFFFFFLKKCEHVSMSIRKTKKHYDFEFVYAVFISEVEA